MPARTRDGKSMIERYQRRSLQHALLGLPAYRRPIPVTSNDFGHIVSAAAVLESSARGRRVKRPSSLGMGGV